MITELLGILCFVAWLGIIVSFAIGNRELSSCFFLGYFLLSPVFMFLLWGRRVALRKLCGYQGLSQPGLKYTYNPKYNPKWEWINLQTGKEVTSNELLKQAAMPLEREWM